MAGHVGVDKQKLEEALRLGDVGPFFGTWANLRLGCIADLQARRGEAIKYYQTAAKLAKANSLEDQLRLAEGFMESRYVGSRGGE